MTAIIIEDFGGRMPRRTSRLLPENYAQIAENCNLNYGDLRGHNDFILVHEFSTGSNPKRVWKVKNTAQTEEAWYGSTDPKAELLKSPIINDAFDRYYLFQEGQPPKILTFDDLVAEAPGDNLAFGQPANPPTLTPVGGVDTNLYTRVYTYTFVTEWGEESHIAPPTSINVKLDVAAVDIDINNSPAPTIAGRTFQSVRIYRAVTGIQGGQFYYVADISYATGTISYTDVRSDLEVALGSPLNSSQNDSAPDGIWGARLMANGSIVAFKGRDLYFSVPYLPHAWPEDWRLTVGDLIVGVEVQGQNVMVMTQGCPVLLYGSYPDALGMLKFSFPEPCISYGSITAAPEGVYYGGYGGVVLFTTTGTLNVTHPLIARHSWQTDYFDFNLRAERLDTHYVASRSGGDGFVIDSLEERTSLIDLVGWITIGDISSNVFTGDIIAISFDAVYAFNTPAGAETDYRWRSKEFVMDKPTNFGALMVHIEPRETEWIPTPILNPGYSYPLEMDKTEQILVRVWRDGELVFEGPVRDREQHRLPSDEPGTVWEVEVQGQCRVERIGIAEVGRELEKI